MQVVLKFNINEHLYLRDPDSSEVGRSIVKNAIELIDEIGFEQFTFKKLAKKISCTEATIYRYFGSKYKLLNYILNWYWCFLEFSFNMRLHQVSDASMKLDLILKIMTHNDVDTTPLQNYDLEQLHNIVVSESSKAYLVKEVDEINKEMVFSPLKSLCNFIGDIIRAMNPQYSYPNSLASTLLETAHEQQFFSEHLPKLTDNKSSKQHKKYVYEYLRHLAFSVIKNN